MSVFRAGGKKSSESVFPSIRPTLDLDFANSKTLDPRITFERASGGTYVGADGLIKYAGVNEPRFDHDPVTGESLGLLIEESRTNLIEYSEDVSNWSYNVNITSNTSDTVSPNGLNTATKLFDTTLENSQVTRYRPLASYSENDTYTFSIFVKAAERDKIRITLQNVSATINFIRAHINLSTGNIENSGAYGDATFSSTGIFKYPNDWYKIFITGTLGITTTNVEINAFVQFPPDFPSLGSGGVRTGDGTSGIYIWGAQLEQGSFPTSYIPTEGSTRTRSVDKAYIKGSNFSSWYNQTEGSIFCRYKNSSLDISDIRGVWGLENITDPDSGLRSPQSGADRIRLYFNDNFSPTNIDIFRISTEYRNSIVAYNQFENLLLMDGKPDFVSASPHTNRNNLYGISIGTRTLAGASALCGHISRLTYYPKRLPNSQLQALTR